MSGEPEVIEPGWAVARKVRAVTTTRIGGYSSGPWSSMNLADHVGDEAESVVKNRAKLKTVLDLPCEPAWLNQTHSSRVIDLAESPNDQMADGAISSGVDVVCAVMTADCLPLFLVDVEATCVAVLHVGWRGLAAGIIESGLEKMRVPNHRIMAWSGPAIGPRSFEVGQEVCDQLGGSAADFRPSRRDGYYLANIYGLVDGRLRNAGVTSHGWHSYCTVRDDERFFSFRRDGVTGRMASLIWITE